MTASLEPWISESEMMRGVRGVVLRGKALLKQSENTEKRLQSNILQTKQDTVATVLY